MTNFRISYRWPDGTRGAQWVEAETAQAAMLKLPAGIRSIVSISTRCGASNGHKRHGATKHGECQNLVADGGLCHLHARRA